MPAMTFRTGAVATALLGAAGCAVSAEPAGMVMTASPAGAFNDVPFTMTISGGPFRAAYQIDTTAGTGAVDVDAFSLTLLPVTAAGGDPVAATKVSWMSEHKLAATLPAGIPSGVYDVAVRDPRGFTLPLSAAFTSLGPDRGAPQLTLTAPTEGTLLGENTSQWFRFEANDGPGWIGGLHWHAWTDAQQIGESDCLVAAESHRAACLLMLELPAATTALDVVYLEMTALDRGLPIPNPMLRKIPFPLAPRPTVTAGCTPSVGPAGGGTEVTILGTNFIPALPGAPGTGTEVVISVPDDASLIVVAPVNGGTTTRVVAKMPPHEEGEVELHVRNGKSDAKACTFTFLPAPVIRAITPPVGPSGGGTYVVIVGNHFAPDATVELEGQVEAGLLSPIRISESRIEGVMPPGTGRVGFVVDAGLAGRSAVVYGFTYQDAYPDPVPAPASGDGSPP